jgi:hypothetical protein
MRKEEIDLEIMLSISQVLQVVSVYLVLTFVKKKIEADVLNPNLGD